MKKVSIFEIFIFTLFGLTAIFGGVGLIYFPDNFTAPLNACLSIGTGGIVSFIFYYGVTKRLENSKHNIIKMGALRAYQDAKYNIAIAIIHASQKGGRKDLQADTATINAVLSVKGFKALFRGGREYNEGYYAFINQMSEKTPEFEEIIFNLKIINRAIQRIVDVTHIEDRNAYDQFIRLDSIIRRIENNGAGYDESKRLCQFIWEIFAGWSHTEGDYGYDLIEKMIEAI
ncbi:MAG: hypothetical protein H6855_06755 [Rhodospirillales bacterium]|nr:hypothetical protein [Rhodospirillales bacterium]